MAGETKVSLMTYLDTVPDDAKIYVVKPGDTTPYYTTKAALLAGIIGGSQNLESVLTQGDRPIKDISASTYSFILEDRAKLITASEIANYTLNKNIFPIGTVLKVLPLAGDVSVLRGTGISLVSNGNSNKLIPSNNIAIITHISGNGGADEYWTYNVVPITSNFDSSIPQVTASGTDTYTATISGVTAYNNGDVYLVKFINGNTRECSLNINSLGAIRLQRNNEGLLIGGDILDGGEMLCVYDSAIPAFRVIGTAQNRNLTYVTNADSETITKGMVVFMSGGTGDRITIKRASNESESSSLQTVGFVLSESILPGKEGLIMTEGLLDGLSILPTTTFADGDALYLGAQPGSITNVKPSAPNFLVYLGVVTTASNISEGRIYIRLHNGNTNKSIANQAYTGTPIWTGTTAPSGTLTASYSWNQIGNMVTVRINLSYVNGGSALTAVTIPLPTDCPSPYVASGGAPSNNRVIAVGGGIMQTNFSPSTATTYVLLKTNSTNTGFDIIAQRASANYQVVTVSVTYLTS